MGVGNRRSVRDDEQPNTNPSASSSVRVLLAEDHNVFREALGALLEQEADIEIVGQARGGTSAIEEACRLRPDVVIMDISMPDLNGVDATREILKECPNIRVLCLSVHREGAYVRAMLEAGAAGYLLKKNFSEEVVTAVRSVAKGDTYLCPQVTSIVVQNNIREGGDGRATRAYTDLTEKERQILQLIAEGRDCKEVAERAGIAHKTVLRHRQRVMEKTGRYSDAALTRYALEQGLADL